MVERDGGGSGSFVRAGLAFGALFLLVSCAAPGPGGYSTQSIENRDEAYGRLADRLDRFAVGGAVHTSDGLLLPETITIEIRSEICVESRRPGTRFWSLDYDTCFSYVDLDTVDARGEYSLEVPCIDADKTYESRHGFGDLRLVQRGPVSFVVVSDADWRHQETFSSSRYQRRDLVLTLDTDVLWIIDDDTPFHELASDDSPEIGRFDFGTSVDVVRFHLGWAEARLGQRIGWIGLHHLGSEEEMKERAPFKRKPESKPRRSGS